MRVFLSWSKRRSKAVADAWAVFLPDIIQSLETFLSSVDLEAGVRWTSDLADALGDMDHGIICVTPENREEPWIHFEAGALSKNPGKSKVMPCLFEIDILQLPPSLAQFNCRKCDEAGVWEIVKSINNDLKKGALDSIRLRKAFEKHFPDFKARLDKVEALSDGEKAAVKPERKADDMAAETLTLVRQLVKQQAAPPRVVAVATLSESDRAAVLQDFDDIVEKIITLRRDQTTTGGALIGWKGCSYAIERVVKAVVRVVPEDLRQAIIAVGKECFHFELGPAESRAGKMEEIELRAKDISRYLRAALNL